METEILIWSNKRVPDPILKNDLEQSNPEGLEKVKVYIQVEHNSEKYPPLCLFLLVDLVFRTKTQYILLIRNVLLDFLHDQNFSG